MSSDGWTLIEAVKQVAGARWDQWIAAKKQLAALPTVRFRVVSSGISSNNSEAEDLRQRQAGILAQRAPLERRVRTLWNEIWSELRTKMLSGSWTSAGSRGSATSAPAPIYGPGWCQLSVKKLDQSILIERGTKIRIFNVRILPGEIREQAQGAAAGQELVDRPPLHGPFAGWALDEAVERIVGKASNEASMTALTSAIASGHLVPYLADKDGGLSQLLDKGACIEIIAEYFKKCTSRAAENCDLILFPTVCAPNAPDLLSGLSLAHVMSTYVLNDPELLRWAPLAIAAEETMRRFVEQGWYYPIGWHEWRVTVGTFDPEDEFEFGESPIGILMAERSDGDLNVRRTKLVARRRFGCLMKLLSTSKIEARGDPVRSKDDRQILASVWSDNAYYVDADRGYLLVENPNSQDRHDALTLRYRAVLLKKPGSIMSATESHDQGNPSAKSRSGSLRDARAACRAWLMGLMLESPEVKPKPKPAYRQDSRDKWPELTDKHFTKSWEEAVEETDAIAWAKAGRPRGTTKK
ncbi:hypothetical protein [Bradyrhizobium sp.]|uniref:hypothetical protein n=1 Tax=Bradyrhizobium sp. TaxID=376 RepID=UPI0025C06A56|nr:hypothetical protein [Bradyrhizobium sp.]